MTGPKSSHQASDASADRWTIAMEALAHEVREHRDQICDRLKGVQDAIDDLRDQVQRVCNDRLPAFKLQSMAADPLDPQFAEKLNQLREPIACLQCEQRSFSLAAALREGWTELCHTSQATQYRTISQGGVTVIYGDGGHGQDWEFLGVCPDCRQREDEQVEATRRPVGREDAEIVESSYCCETPRLMWNGDPDRPGVTCENCGYVVAEMGSLADLRLPEKTPAAETSTQEEQVTGTAGTNFLWEDS